jgi:thiamine-phosphate pyrophosphorylase
VKNIRGIHILLSAISVNGRSPEELARIAVAGGASVIQLREKNMSMDELLPVAKKMRAICRDSIFIVNDRADLAKIIEADGVHLGQDDLPIEYARKILGDKTIIGVTCDSVDDAKKAEQSGANYIGFGHMFPTASKQKNSPPKSVVQLQAVVAAVDIPVIAIGGITAQNVSSIIMAGLGGVAVLGAFSSSENPEEAIKILTEIYHGK